MQNSWIFRQFCYLDFYLNWVSVAVDVIESTSSYTDVEDEDIKEEFKKLELEVGSGNLQVPISQTGVDGIAGE